MEKALASFRGSPKPPTLPSGLPIRNVVSKERVCLVQYEEILKHLHIYAHHTACPRTCSVYYGENVFLILLTGFGRLLLFHLNVNRSNIIFVRDL